MWRCILEQAQISDEAKLWAVASYGSLFLGVPLGVVPLIQRDDAYALRHAKDSVGVWIGSMVAAFVLAVLAFGLFFLTCGLSNFAMIPLFFVVALWPLGHALHGLILAINGDEGRAFGHFGIGERLFSGVHVKEEPAELAAAD